MKIGDEVYVHGYVDEIRKDCIIIRNDGGYFGTVSNEVATDQNNRNIGEWIGRGEADVRCSVCGWYNDFVRNYCPNCGAYMKREDDE